MSSLLPFTATDLEKAAEAAITPRLPVPNAVLWNPRACPGAFLPWLAHSLSVDAWDPEWPEEVKRDVIASTVFVHRRKGTLGSIRRALTSAGFQGAIILEGRYFTPHNGQISYGGAEQFGGPDNWSTAERYDTGTLYDGSEVYGAPGHWAEYRVELPKPITIEQSISLRRILKATAPARCRLKRLYFLEVANTHTGISRYDGVFSYGAV